MAGGQPLRLGPFVGGLNIASDPTAIADAELVELTNFELDIDGSLLSRTPIQEQQGHVGWVERIICIGEAIFGTDHYVIGSNSSGVYHYLNGTWTAITTTFQAAVAIQYADKVYLVSKPGSGNGGKWDPVGGFVAVAAIPKGQAAVVHKERLFICPGSSSTTNTSRLSFSDPGNFDVWPAPNFIDIGQGDGTKLVDVTVFQDNLLLFKDQSTYVLAYDVRPADAVVRKISLTIGVNKQFNVVNYENQVYVFHDGWVYEILNYDFNRLNTKVPFVRDETVPSLTTFSDENMFLSIIEDRLICRFFRKIYVYGLRTRTWSEWKSKSDALQFFGPIVTIRPTTGNEYYSGSCLSSNRSVFKFFNKHTSSDQEKAFGTAITASENFSEVTSNGWGTSDLGHSWANAGGSASDYAKTGTEGTHSHPTVNVFRLTTLPVNLVDVYQKIFIKTNVLATGAEMISELTARNDLSDTHYNVRLNFATDQTMTISIRKRIAGVQTILTTASSGLTHVAGTQYGVALLVQGNQIKARAWLATNPEPTTWQVTATDSDIAVAGSTGPRTALATGNTSVNPVFSYDNYEVISLSLTIHDIECITKTKNYDMAVSHQFKRLWWWGADVSSTNDIVGTATPIIVTFDVLWSQIDGLPWSSIEGKPWSQIFATPSSVETTVAAIGGADRKFAKFQKSLRYRQINFKVKLTTDGSSADGPARLFTMIIVTESKQAVPKSVN